MPACVYCGEDAGAFDEHDACVAAALEVALEDPELEAECPQGDNRLKVLTVAADTLSMKATENTERTTTMQTYLITTRNDVAGTSRETRIDAPDVRDAAGIATARHATADAGVGTVAVVGTRRVSR